MKKLKPNVIRDDLLINSNGLYAYLPFMKLDKNNKAVFKVGMTSTAFHKRIENYHTYFPLGVYICLFLENPTELRYDKSITSYYKEIENFVFKELEHLKAKRIVSSTRVKATEWFYCDEKQLLKAFQAAQFKFGGILTPFHLNNINKDAATASKKKHYNAEIYFDL